VFDDDAFTPVRWFTIAGIRFSLSSSSSSYSSSNKLLFEGPSASANRPLKATGVCRCVRAFWITSLDYLT
jgi:hypothetical protein